AQFGKLGEVAVCHGMDVIVDGLHLKREALFGDKALEENTNGRTQRNADAFGNGIGAYFQVVINSGRYGGHGVHLLTGSRDVAGADDMDRKTYTLRLSVIIIYTFVCV